jgi:hypothetical protein
MPCSTIEREVSAGDVVELVVSTADVVELVVSVSLDHDAEGIRMLVESSESDLTRRWGALFELVSGGHWRASKQGGSSAGDET